MRRIVCTRVKKWKRYIVLSWLTHKHARARAHARTHASTHARKQARTHAHTRITSFDILFVWDILLIISSRTLHDVTTAFLYTAGHLPTINMGRPFSWRHLSVPAWTIDLEFRAAGNSAGSLTPPSCTPQNHSVPHIARCSNLPHVTSQCNVARDWVRYAPFCFWCASRGRKWGPQHHRFITGPPTPPTKRQNGGLLSYIARWYKSSDVTLKC